MTAPKAKKAKVVNLTQDELRALVAASSAGVNLTTEELAERLRTSPENVHVMHSRGTGPKSFRRGKRRLYPLPEVEAWEKSRLATSGTP